MLVTDDSNGNSTGKERDQLQAMVAVGSEFITYSDPGSTVQKSGEFARITVEDSEATPRFLLLHETSQTHEGQGQPLTGAELRTLAPNTRLRKRSRLFMSEIDAKNGDLPFREVAGYKTSTRISRYNGFGSDTAPRALPAMYEANYTAQAGKRRLFSMGDGKVLLAREVALAGDSRHFNDSMRARDEHGHSKARGLRAARVELVEINPVAGSVSAPVFSFDVHSGVGFDASHKFFSDSIRNSSADMYSDTNIFAAFSGTMFGSSLNLPEVLRVPRGGDASDTYAVAEPARAKASDGREYTSMIAVFPATDDVYDNRSAGPYRLTCKRTLPGGGVATAKINFPALPSLPKHYLAAFGMSLHRTGPNTVALRVNVHAMQFGIGGTIQSSSSDAFFMWTQNNGETWTYAPVTAGFPGVFPYGGMLVKDKHTLLAFSWYNSAETVHAIEVHSITSAGTAKISTIHPTAFYSGLMAPGGSGPTGGWSLVDYVPLGFGGAVYRKTKAGKKKRLWMQFDPSWIYKREHPKVLDYPGSRPMLMVSDDGGLTWQRKFLPTPWCFRVGFVVAVDETTLAVPILSPRKGSGAQIRAAIYVSKDGGESWKPSAANVALPVETWADGDIVVGESYLRPSDGQTLMAQDVSDSAQRYNRGELLPMIALRDSDGNALPANPARPWMADHKIKEPDYA